MTDNPSSPTRPTPQCYWVGGGVEASRDLVEATARVRTLLSRQVYEAPPPAPSPDHFTPTGRSDPNGSALVSMDLAEFAALGHVPQRVGALSFHKKFAGTMLPSKTSLTLYSEEGIHGEWAPCWPVWAIGMHNINYLMHEIPTDLSLLAAVTSGGLKLRASNQSWGVVYIDPGDIFDSLNQQAGYGLLQYHYRLAGRR